MGLLPQSVGVILDVVRAGGLCLSQEVCARKVSGHSSTAPPSTYFVVD